MKQDDPQLVFWSESQWTATKGSVQAIHDAYWMADEEGRIVLSKYGRDLFPQCNGDLSVAEYVRNKVYPWAQIKQVGLVLIPERS